jgi:phosphoribosylamine--glycine ligase
MKILVTGKGGREHALVTALHESPGSHQLFSWPGSDAISGLAERAPAADVPQLVVWMQREGIDLCVAGDESLLVTGEGLANLCRAAGIPCWGPPKESAQLEASKEFAKHFLKHTTTKPMDVQRESWPADHGEVTQVVCREKNLVGGSIACCVGPHS